MTEKQSIPNYELRHNNEEVTFAIRSVEEVIEMFGRHNDTPHSHQYYTVLWSQNYSGKHIIDYKEYEMKPNDIFFVSPGQVHQVIHNETPKGMVILFSCDFLRKNYVNESFISNLNLFSDIGNTPPIHITHDTAFQLKELVYKMRGVLSADDPFKFDKIGAYLKLFLIECIPYAYSPEAIDNDQFLQAGGQIIKKFKFLLELHFKDWHKVNAYAEELNISSDYLNNVVKSSMGKTAKELIQQRLILESKRMGLHTELSTKEIAYHIGFNDPSHFSRFFTKHEGQSFTSFQSALNKELTA